MKPNIIYLFNSALNQTYKENLLKILALPVGCITQFRYTVEYNVPADLDISSLVNLECLIVFVDRFSNNTYTYYPIRKGKIISTTSGGGRIYLKCKLTEYCTIKDPIKYTNYLKEILKGAPELTNNNPYHNNDGYYIQIGEDSSNEITISNESWESTINNLSKTYNLYNDNSIFLKIFLENLSDKKNKIKFNEAGKAILKSDNAYLINIQYYDERQGQTKKQIITDIRSPLISNETTKFNIGCRSDLLRISFETEKRIQPAFSTISVFIKDGEKEEFCVDIPIQISSLRMLTGFIFYGIVLALLIFTEKIFPSSDVLLSIAIELMKWGIAFRVFYKLGSLSNLLLK